MPQSPDWNKYIDAGAQFVALTRADARRRAKELVAQGMLAQGQVQSFVDDLVEESRRRTDDMLDVVRKEIQRQVRQLGIATKDDLARLEARLAKQGGAKQATAKKDGAKKSAALKSGKKAAAKKAAKKDGAKKATGKKSAKKPGVNGKVAPKAAAS